ncbi:hypothetical protein EV401DRAFT_642432 [Pisolithus croceorrhizus]|nr:hypothetical protein EV401DRAFT_642432 [Pisolithus croceorrhizus]
MATRSPCQLRLTTLFSRCKYHHLWEFRMWRLTKMHGRGLEVQLGHCLLTRWLLCSCAQLTVMKHYHPPRTSYSCVQSSHLLLLQQSSSFVSIILRLNAAADSCLRGPHTLAVLYERRVSGSKAYEEKKTRYIRVRGERRWGLAGSWAWFVSEDVGRLPCRLN